MEQDNKLLSDDQLFLKAKSGELEAFNLIFQRHRKQIFNYTWRILGDYQKAQDVTQDVFIQVFNNLKGYEPRGKASAWIYRIAHNLCMNLLKRKSIEKSDTSLDEPVGKDGDMKMLDFVADESLRPDLIAQKQEFERRIQRAILSLEPIYRSVLVLCAVQGKSYEETAHILGVRIGTVRFRLNRARAMCMEIFKKGENGT